MDVGLASSNPRRPLADYAKAGDLLVKNGTFVTIADVNDTFLARAGITGWEHQIEMHHLHQPRLAARAGALVS